MSTTENEMVVKSNHNAADNYLREMMRQNFEFWHGVYKNSMINCPLVWKKAIRSDFEIMKKVNEGWKNDTRQNMEEQMQQFLELWYYAIRKSNFEIMMKEWEEFSKNITEEQLMIYVQIIQSTKQYWKNIQDKNIE